MEHWRVTSRFFLERVRAGLPQLVRLPAPTHKSVNLRQADRSASRPHVTRAARYTGSWWPPYGLAIGMLRGSISIEYRRVTPLAMYHGSYNPYISTAVRCYAGIGHQPERRSLTKL